ncbi:MAG: hypothetical protein ISS70_05040 [Phycisphaerae bacterium]|nr:hypothetical protein [Phycisphaerae bacterium]
MPTIKDQQSRAMTLQFALCAFVLALAFAGCQQEQRQEEVVLALPPDSATVAVSSDYAAQAIEAAGGLDAWTKTKEMRFMCVVTLYQPDGSYYLSEQRYAVYPWSNSIQISAVEPQGTSVWQLSRGQFDVLQGSGQIDELSAAVPSRCLAEAILNIVTAPARFLDASARFVRQDSAVKIQGQWYYPIEKATKSGILSGEHMAKAIFYQNRDNSLIDLLHVACTETGKSLAVRGYDYDQIEKGGLLVPTRIEVFTTDGQGGSQTRLVKIDCHKARAAK